MVQDFVTARKAGSQMPMGDAIINVKHTQCLRTGRGPSGLYVGSRVRQVLNKFGGPFLAEFMLVGCHRRFRSFIPLRGSRFVMSDDRPGFVHNTKAGSPNL